MDTDRSFDGSAAACSTEWISLDSSSCYPGRIFWSLFPFDGRVRIKFGLEQCGVEFSKEVQQREGVRIDAIPIVLDDEFSERQHPNTLVNQEIRAQDILALR